MILRGKIIEDTFLDLKNMSIKIEGDTQISCKEPMSKRMTLQFLNTMYKNKENVKASGRG